MDLILGPAYGRDYISVKDVLKDFKILTPKYAGHRVLNKQDFFKYRDELMPDVTAVKIRYNHLTQAYYTKL